MQMNTLISHLHIYSSAYLHIRKYLHIKLPDSYPFIRVDPEFVAFFNMEGFVKFGHIRKRAVYPEEAWRMLISEHLINQRFLALLP